MRACAPLLVVRFRLGASRCESDGRSSGESDKAAARVMNGASLSRFRPPSSMWRIAPRLYLGDYRSGLSALDGMERPVEPEGRLAPFAGIVSLCPVPLFATDHVSGPASPGTEWLRIPILDGGTGENEFEASLGVTLPFVRRRSKEGNVLVHCAAGMSRSVATVVAYLCERGLGLGAALEHVARSKAAAMNLGVEDEVDLVAPAWEFKACLTRLYGGSSSVEHADRRETLTNGR